MIYFTSDLHLCHDKDFIYEARGFNDICEHDRGIVKNWNDLVTWEDEVFILGDLMLKDDARGLSLLQQLAGKKHIIFGNHDTATRIAAYETLNDSFDILGYAHAMRVQGLNFYLSHYPTITTNADVDKPLKQRVINLCGHTHTLDKFYDFDKGLIYHVELDAHGNKPVSINQVIEDIKTKLK